MFKWIYRSIKKFERCGRESSLRNSRTSCRFTILESPGIRLTSRLIPLNHESEEKKSHILAWRELLMWLRTLGTFIRARLKKQFMIFETISKFLKKTFLFIVLINFILHNCDGKGIADIEKDSCQVVVIHWIKNINIQLLSFFIDTNKLNLLCHGEILKLSDFKRGFTVSLGRLKANSCAKTQRAGNF